MRVALVPLRFWHLPLLWYWRNYTVPKDAFQRPTSPWWWMLYWYFGQQRRFRLSAVILCDDRAVGYCCIRDNRDTGIYIGQPLNRGIGIGRQAMRLLETEAWRRGLRWISAGSAHPDWLFKIGFRACGPWVVDHGVVRLPLIKELG